MKKHGASKKANRTKKKNTAPNPSHKAAPTPQNNRRDFLQRSMTWGIGILALGGTGTYAFNAMAACMEEQDLTKIGNGTPSIVQIHDPQCRLCRSLQKSTRKALEAFEEGDIQYMVANIKTGQGRTFAANYGVPHVTLLLFDGKGTLIQTINGQQRPEYLKGVFAGLKEL